MSSSPRWHARSLAAAVVLAGLAGCTSEFARNGGGVLLTEKTVFGALKAVHASDEQRGTILGIFEEARPKLAAAREQENDLRAQIRDLSPREANYLPQADALAARLADVTGQEARIQARFVQDVANALSERQWDQWLAYFRRVEVPPVDRIDPGPGQQRGP